jgi:hypothetical protein
MILGAPRGRPAGFAQGGAGIRESRVRDIGRRGVDAASSLASSVSPTRYSRVMHNGKSVHATALHPPLPAGILHG